MTKRIGETSYKKTAFGIIPRSKLIPLENVILLNLNLPSIELKVETTVGRKNYVGALRLADNYDYTKLESIFKLAIDETAKELDLRK